MFRHTLKKPETVKTLVFDTQNMRTMKTVLIRLFKKHQQNKRV